MSYRLKQIISRSGTGLCTSTQRPHLPEFYCCFKDTYVSVPDTLYPVCALTPTDSFSFRASSMIGRNAFPGFKWTIVSAVVELDSSHCACCGGKG